MPPSRNQKWLLGTANLVVASDLLYYCYCSATSQSAMILFDEMIFIVKCFIFVTFMHFLMEYGERRMNRWGTAISYIIAFIISIIATTNRNTHCLYRVLGKKKGFMGYFLVVKYTKFYHLVVGVWALLMIVGCAALLARIISTKGAERRKGFFTFLAILISVVGSIYKLATGDNHLDYMMVSYNITLFLTIIITRIYGLSNPDAIAWQATIEDSDDGLVVTDREGNILYTNSVVKKNNPKALELDTERQTELKEMIQRGNLIYHLDGRDIKFKVDDIYEGNTKLGRMAWISDVTFEQEYQRELIRLRSEAEEANSAKSNFLAAMSHEIRTPMNAISGFSELIESENDIEICHDYARDITNSTKILLDLINKVLDISKIESGKMEIVDKNYSLKSLIRSVDNVIGYASEKKGLAYSSRISEDMPDFLFGAENTIYEILINVLNNSVKYTPVGLVSLEVLWQGNDDKEGNLVLVMSDTGQGMTPEFLAHIFDKFARDDTDYNRNVEGTGLGMSIVKDYIDLMKGSIDIESEIGVGTKTTVVIPQKVSDASKYEPISDKENRGIGGMAQDKENHFTIPDAKLLVVDDNAINLKVIAATLKKYGNTIDTASSGKEAIAKLVQSDYDIVFMDHMMPEMDGLEAMKKIRKIAGRENTCIILLTANAIGDIKEKMLNEGFDGFLTKPMDMQALKETLIVNIPEDKIVLSSNERVADTTKTTFNNNDTYINYFEGIAACGDSVEDYKEILSFFIDNYQNHVTELVEQFNGKDYDSYTISVHGLKSSMRSIGANTLADLAYELEMAGKEKKYDVILEKHQLLLDIYRDTIETAKCYLNTCEANKVQKSEFSEELSQEGFEIILSNLKTLIASYEHDDAIEIIEEMSEFELDGEKIKILEKLKQSLKAGDQDTAMLLVEELT